MSKARGVSFTVGVHNLHDRAGVPTLFATVLLFCEAIPATIRAKVRRRVKDGWARLRGYRVVVCGQQRDLVVAHKRRLFKLHRTEYRLAHHGIELVTPHRGTFVLFGEIRATGQLVAFVLEHRINSWWKPERGEEHERAGLWHGHQGLTLSWTAELEAAGYLVIAGGDENAPHDVLAFAGLLEEVSTSLDRLGCSLAAAWSHFQRLSKSRSDHHRIRATITLPAPKEHR